MSGLLELRCPRCNTVGDWQEWANRPTSQPFELELLDGKLAYGDWGSYDAGDGTENESVVCGSCEARWESLAGLEVEMRAVQALADLELALQAYREADPQASFNDVWRALNLLRPIGAQMREGGVPS